MVITRLDQKPTKEQKYQHTSSEKEAEYGMQMRLRG